MQDSTAECVAHNFLSSWVALFGGASEIYWPEFRDVDVLQVDGFLGFQYIEMLYSYPILPNYRIILRKTEPIIVFVIH